MGAWPKRSIGDLVELKYGKALKAEDRPLQGPYPVYGSNGVVGFSEQPLVSHPTIVIGRKGAVGAAHLAENGCWPIDTTFYTVPRENCKINLRYLLCGLRLLNLAQHAITSTIPGLNRNTLAEQLIPVPPIVEQHRIVNLLDQADELRRLREQADRRTANLIPALFHEMFGDPRHNTYPFLSLQHLCRDGEGVKCGPFGTQLNQAEFRANGVPLWGIKHVNRNFQTPTIEFIDSKKADDLDAYSLLPGDIVMTRKGTVGKCAIYPSNLEKGIMHSDLLRVRLDQDRCLPGFLSAQLTFSKEVEQQVGLVSSGAIMAGINVTKLKHIKVFLPPLPLQQQFAARVAEIRALEAPQAESRRRLDELFQSMLHRAFQGEL